jgi:hypothetical protein
MGTFRMIVYPFGIAIFAICVAMFLGVAAFGPETLHWEEWQNELVGTAGTVAGLAGAVFGLWLAIRAEHQTMW